MKADRAIPQNLQEEIENDVSLKAQIIITASEMDLELAPKVTQQELAKSIVLNARSFDKNEDELSFIEKKEVLTDKNEKVMLYLFNYRNKGSYDNQKYIRYVAFQLDDKKRLISEVYSKSYDSGKPYDTNKEKEEALKEIEKEIKHQGRWRVK
jgi:hypothetical protein